MTRAARAVTAPTGKNSGERLIDAALEVLGRTGVGGLTIAEVSRVSGVSNGSLYHRFGGREGLLVACQERFFEKVTAEWLSEGSTVLDQLDPGLLLEAVVDGFELVFRRNRMLFQAFMVTGYHESTLRDRGIRFTREVSTLFTNVLVERLGCTPAQADTAYRLLFGHAILSVMFDDDEVTALPVPSAERRRTVLAGIRAVLEE